MIDPPFDDRRRAPRGGRSRRWERAHRCGRSRQETMIAVCPGAFEDPCAEARPCALGETRREKTPFRGGHRVLAGEGPSFFQTLLRREPEMVDLVADGRLPRLAESAGGPAPRDPELLPATRFPLVREHAREKAARAPRPVQRLQDHRIRAEGCSRRASRRSARDRASGAARRCPR